ncbi:MAG: sigma-70 family RNA polymerase sigma factor [Clostridia bacterium]|nr:sigma-70 family RNA polymerase sigma factor [Clostridia bacterium]
MNYESLTDEELVALAKSDKGKPFEILIGRYDVIIRLIASKYYCSDADRDDLKQVGAMALYSAVDNYNGQSNFKAFAYTCINNSVLSALRSNNRKKNEPLKNYIPLSGFGDGDMDKSEVIVDVQAGPEDFLIDSEKREEVETTIKNTLSELEFKIFNLNIQGYTYEEISKKIGKDDKSVDNAIQRIRRKLRAKFGG